MTENSENMHMSFLYPIDWLIFFPGVFDNFHANQDTLMSVPGKKFSGKNFNMKETYQVSTLFVKT